MAAKNFFYRRKDIHNPLKADSDPGRSLLTRLETYRYNQAARIFISYFHN